jgi:hypothetical protein
LVSLVKWGVMRIILLLISKNSFFRAYIIYILIKLAVQLF